MQHIHKEKITQKLKGKGIEPSDKTWIQEFQWALSAVIQELGGEDKVKGMYADTVKLWNAAGLPEELKRK